MSAIAASGPYVNIEDTSASPPRSAPPASPTSSHLATRYTQFVRGQNSPFPTTPTSAAHTTSLEPPSGVSYADFLATWNDTHVARWLNEIKCGVHAPTFRTNEIRGDVLLELDQSLLKEMGITSIGDRLRIINGVKALRVRVASRTPVVNSPRPDPLPHHRPVRSNDYNTDNLANNAQPNPHTRHEPRRPPPLVLPNNSNRSDLPHIVRDLQPDSAPPTRSIPNPIRPLPQPNPNPSTSNSNAPGGTHSGAHTTAPAPSRPGLPPLPPIPRTQPPQPPVNRTVGRIINNSNPSGRRTPTQVDPPAFTQQNLPPPPAQHQWPTKSSSDNRAGSPLGNLKRGGINTAHIRTGSLGTNSNQPNGHPHHKMPIRPSTGSTHPYANATPTLQPPTSQAHNLSPINESFSSQHATTGTPSPPSYPPTRGAYGSNQSHSNALSLDDLKRKLVKFLLPDESQKFTIDVADCTSGVEILEKALKKVEKGGSRYSNDGEPNEHILSDENGLSIDGWGVYLDMGTEDGPAAPLTGNELLAICQDRDHPIREHGLTLRKTAIASRTGNASPGHGKFLQAGKYTKRASSISILSGLGVHDPEKALDPASSTAAGRLSPTPQTKRPSKLRNFFGQRPPSELITTHLTEYFPFTEKKVLERTARHSILRSSRRDSNASSLIGNGIAPSSSSGHDVPPLPEKHLRPQEDIPRVSLSTEDGRSIDLRSEESTLPPAAPLPPQLLPPIPFPTESFSDSMKSITGSQRQRPLSRMSTASRRLSYMTELRSKRDRTDTASLMTVDEITAEVESRVVNNKSGGSSESEDWTKVESEEAENEKDEQQDDDGSDASYDEEEADDEDDEDDGPGKAMTSKAGKWIKGALIGAGSFGKVYLGMDASNGLLMAVKQVELASATGPNYERKKSMLSALEREIELLKDLQHENIVQYLYSSIDDEYLNIFLEYVPGGSVTALLRNYGAFEEPLVRNFVRQILQGLSYLHERDIIHRDIKGANILVDNKGGVKISDFGISKKVDDNSAPIGGNRMHRPSLQGSVFWMAPEVVKQSVHTQKADIWSVGCLVVEMLTGEHPWAQLTQMQAIFKIGSSEQPTIPSDISAEAQDFLQQTFRLDHTARPSAAELLRHSWIVGKPKSKSSAS
ncbi:hypothetical protein AX16_003661 [Volvariella volvacea WC 439]|nr:hypothetical protein AX16_003661 [Volvariella volvacea WC 439]